MSVDAKQVWKDMVFAYDDAMSKAKPRGYETTALNDGEVAAIVVLQKALDEAAAEGIAGKARAKTIIQSIRRAVKRIRG